MVLVIFPALVEPFFVPLPEVVVYSIIKVVVHEAEQDGYWAEVPAIPGCAIQGETFEELLQNLYDAIEACLSVDTVTGH